MGIIVNGKETTLARFSVYLLILIDMMYHLLKGAF